MTNGSPLQMCRCCQCRSGLRTKAGSHIVALAVRRFRHRTKLALRLGTEPPVKIAVPYTD